VAERRDRAPAEQAEERIMPTSSNRLLVSHGFFESTAGQLVFFGAATVAWLVFALSYVW
jgi:hypothetical protein